MNTEQPKRTPQQIIGDDALTQLIFEGYEVMPARRSSDEQAEVVAWQWQQCKSLQPGVWPEQWNNIELRPGEDRTQYWRDLAARIPDEVRVRPLYASPPAVAAGGVTEALREALTSLLAFTKFELDADMATRKPWSTLIAKAEAALSLPTPPSRGEGV